MGGHKEQQHQDAMAPPQKPAPGKKLADEAGAPSAAGGAAVPKQGAPIKGQPKAESAAGTAAAPEPGTPVIELEEKTKVALAGQMEGKGDDDVLDCALCMVCTNHTFGDAVAVTSSCGHPFHPKCIKDAMKREKTKCPCGAAFPPGKDPLVPVAPMLKRMMNRTKVQCPQGCGEVAAFEFIHGHIHNDDGCPSTPYRCGNAGCGVLFLRKNKDEHLSSCPYRLVPCELCKQPIKHRDLLQHKAEQCLRRKVHCPHCQGEHLFCDTEEHMRRCSGGVSMKNITELKDMMAQQQQTVSQLLSRVAQQQQMMAQQQQTIERQQREIAELQHLRPLAVPELAQSLQLAAVEGMLRPCQQREAVTRGAVEQEREQSLAELRRLDEQQTQRVPGLAEARLQREAAARAAVEQQRKQGLAELRRLDEQQSLRVWRLGEERAWARERAALPQRLTVRGTGIGNCAGEYSMRSERVNGAAVWGKDNFRLYRSREGHWGLTGEADGPQRNRGHWRLSSQPGSRAPLGGGWEYNPHNDMSRADGWVKDTYNITVTAP